MNILNNHTYTNSEIRKGVEVGSYCSIAGDVKFMNKDEHACIINPKIISCYPFKGLLGYGTDELLAGGKGPIIIGNDVWIGEGARIMSNVRIGDGAVIAAQTVVTKDVPPYALCAGNPGRIKKYRFTKEQIGELLKIKWWEWSVDKIKENFADFLDVDIFIRKYKVKEK